MYKDRMLVVSSTFQSGFVTCAPPHRVRISCPRSALILLLFEAVHAIAKSNEPVTEFKLLQNRGQHLFVYCRLTSDFRYFRSLKLVVHNNGAYTGRMISSKLRVFFFESHFQRMFLAWHFWGIYDHSKLAKGEEQKNSYFSEKI